MSRHSIAISLGHNSSAIAIVDGNIICGYEEERFSLKKSDSAFPIKSIVACIKNAGLPTNTNIYINHWFLKGEIERESKYYSHEQIKSLFPQGTILSVNTDFTHHDGHAYSAEVFAAQNGGLADNYLSVVMDGFGTFGECISIYESKNGIPKLQARVFGFEKSLGMFYQYATAYMAMQMNNHEYKILAYEVHIQDKFAHLDAQIQEMAEDASDKWLMDINKIIWQFDPMISLDALPRIQAYISTILDGVLLKLSIPEIGIEDKRVIISRYTQSYVQKCVCKLIASYKPNDLLLSGGLFYNVKINSELSKQIPGRVCVMPLAGDQGAALGVYQRFEGNLVWPGHLNWGKRSIGRVTETEGLFIANDVFQADEAINYALEQYGFVNLIRGNMEYGPRALCNTSTIALPDPKVTSIINVMNDRTNEMPMAPVMTRSLANEYFDDIDKIHLSLDYMIVTRDYKPGKAESVLGAAHYYSDSKTYTGRPQITSDSLMTGLLNKFGPLVNTSYNYHGVPIVYDDASILNTHKAQKLKHNEPFLTVIIKD